MTWVKGKSGNPAGKKPGTIDPLKAEVRDIFKAAAPGLVELAIKRAYGYTELDDNGIEKQIPGDNLLLKELVRKALPDKIETEVNIGNLAALKLAVFGGE